MLQSSTREPRLLSGVTLKRLAYHQRAARAFSYAEARMADALSLKEIAAEAGMNPCAFSRYFREKVGISFFSLLRAVRIERAIEELERGNVSVWQLAERAGYDHPCSFSRAFKIVTGKTPTEYRAKSIRDVVTQQVAE